MTIYIVKNPRGEEVSSYTDLDKAESVAEKLRAAILQDYYVEEISEEKDRKAA